MTNSRPLDQLPRDIRRRLDRFSEAVDRVGYDQLPMFAVMPREPAHRRAIEAAELVAIESGRKAAVQAARLIGAGYVERRFSQGGFRTTLGLMPFSSGISGPERAALAVSFEEAVTGLVLADVLDEADFNELLGPWASVEE